MDAYFSRLAHRISAPSRRHQTTDEKPLDSCTCGQPVFFRNSICLACQSPLGYEPQQERVLTLVAADEGTWRIDGDPQSKIYRRCANLDTAACNWLVDADDPQDLCVACRLNRTIPDLSVEGNTLRWRKFETAKRRLVAQLLSLGLPVEPRVEDEGSGLAFDFLGPDADGNQPTTGHAGGLITLNIAEADDAHREQVRVQMHEPYRTLLGHFRHEVGHYYWDRLVGNGAWLEDFRLLFGDERLDYGEALQRHYEQGAPTDWQASYISAYATMHPWEDWAETWAHYLHMMDTLETALSFGMRAGSTELDFTPYTHESLHAPDDQLAEQFLLFINAWIELAAMLNELSRSMGQADLYPFVLPAPVIAKLQFVHRVVASAGTANTAMPSPADA